MLSAEMSLSAYSNLLLLRSRPWSVDSQTQAVEPQQACKRWAVAGGQPGGMRLQVRQVETPPNLGIASLSSLFSNERGPVAGASLSEVVFTDSRSRKASRIEDSPAATAHQCSGGRLEL